MSNLSVNPIPSSEYILAELSKPAPKANFIPPEDVPNYIRSKYASRGIIVSDAYIKYEIDFAANGKTAEQLMPEEWEAQFAESSNLEKFKKSGIKSSNLLDIFSNKSIGNYHIFESNKTATSSFPVEVLKYKLDVFYSTQCGNEK